MGFASFLSCVLRNARGTPRGARARRAARAYMGACRAVSRMHRRSRARRPAHGVCVVSFLRLAQRSWHAREGACTPASRGVPLVCAGCCAYAPRSRVRGRLAVGFGRDGKQARARGARRLGTWARRGRLAHVCVPTARARAHASRVRASPFVRFEPRGVAPPAAFVPCVFERPRLPCCRPRACAGLAAPVQPHACSAGRAFGLPARRASSVRRFCLLSSDGACERAAPRAAF